MQITQTSAEESYRLAGRTELENKLFYGFLIANQFAAGYVTGRLHGLRAAYALLLTFQDGPWVGPEVLLMGQVVQCVIPMGGSAIVRTLRTTSAIAAACSVLLFATAPGYAGFIPQTIRVDLPDPGGAHGPPPWAGPPDFVFNLIPGEAERGLLQLEELFGGPESLSYVISGVTNRDPILTIDKTIENDSGFTWTGYEISLPDQGAISFTGSASSDKMTLANQSAYFLDFSEPMSVPVGESVSFSFNILIPSTGPFGFTLTQAPVPEPTALALAIIALPAGVLFIVRRRSRRVH